LSSKLTENWAKTDTTTPQTNNTKKPQPTRQLTSSHNLLQPQTNDRKGTTSQRRPIERTNSNGVHQSSIRGSFQEMTLLFILLLRDFSTFLIMSLEAFPPRRKQSPCDI
jgi:hypothetical protein